MRITKNLKNEKLVDFNVVRLLQIREKLDVLKSQKITENYNRSKKFNLKIFVEMRK